MINDSNILFVGKNKIYLESVDSTNKYASVIVSKTNPIEGTCVYTDFQTDGKGQIGRHWFSDRQNNITASFIFYPRFLKAKLQFGLSMMTSLAIADVLAALNISGIKIKWPNDIYIYNKKVAGILIQNQLQGTVIQHCIVGIGLNVNQIIFPPDIPNPTSLTLELSEKLNSEDILTMISYYLEKRYLQLKSGNFNVLKEAYLNNLYQKDQWSEYESENRGVFYGTIIDVEESGMLIMEINEGQIEKFNFREISFKTYHNNEDKPKNQSNADQKIS